MDTQDDTAAASEARAVAQPQQQQQHQQQQQLDGLQESPQAGERQQQLLQMAQQQQLGQLPQLGQQRQCQQDGRKPPPEQRREAGKRRPPHAYQAVMCDFGKSRKECSHGEVCLLARNALEYWLHPDKYRTILCGHGEACNRNICFFAHNQQELRTLSSRTAGSLLPGEKLLAADLAAETLQQLGLGAHPGPASRSIANSSASGPQLLYVPAAAAASGNAAVGYQHGLGAGSSGGGGLASAQQSVQAVRVAAPSAQQQVLLPVASGWDASQHVLVGQPPSANPSMPQIAYRPHVAAGVALQPPHARVVVVGQQRYAQAAPQQLLLHQHHQHQASYEQHHQAGEVGQQQLLVWQSPLEASGAAASGSAAAVGAGTSHAGGMALVQQQPMHAMMAAGPGWEDASGHYAGYVPCYALPVASAPAGSHMMVGAAGMQQQQQQQQHFTPAQLMHMQQQQVQHVNYEQHHQQQHLQFQQQQGQAEAQGCLCSYCCRLKLLRGLRKA
ncbi:hypothetical protein COO60DRAFT_1705611 [Scenedesmus sp. NREL 46B-D3]|nr:hypothetical protein COO60DRAFT_1705611 [Scenedesmus sp. NREL 46B-D3]